MWRRGRQFVCEGCVRVCVCASACGRVRARVWVCLLCECVVCVCASARVYMRAVRVRARGVSMQARTDAEAGEYKTPLCKHALHCLIHRPVLAAQRLAGSPYGDECG